MNMKIWIAMLAVVSLTGLAHAWELVDPNVDRYYTTRTRVAELVVGAPSTGVNSDAQAWVRFEDDTAALCERPSRPPYFLQGRPTGSYVWVGIPVDSGAKAKISALLTARSTGVELTVIINSQECRLMNISM